MAKCLVCDGPARSAEHVMPRWLTSMLGEGGVLTEEAAFPSETDSATRYDERVTTTLARKTVKVCALCNNGWMSVLESEAKPFLSRLARGQPGIILNDVANILLAWTLKTAVVALAASSHPLERSVARPLLQDLREKRVPRNAFLRVGLAPRGGANTEVVLMPIDVRPGVDRSVSGDVGLQALIGIGAATLRVGWVASGVRATAKSLVQEDDGLVQVFPPPAPSIPWVAGRWKLGPAELPNVGW